MILNPFFWVSCISTPQTESSSFKVLAVESFVGDIASQVVGDLSTVEVLIPAGVDPHSFEPTPQDVARISNCDVLIINGGGMEAWLDPILQNTPASALVITASQGIPFRVIQNTEDSTITSSSTGDPHFWMNPLNVKQYAYNIQDGLVSIKPEWQDTLARNTDLYINQLNELDAWIQNQVNTIPAAQRMLITNHEDLGYFADQYHFQIIGSIIPSFTSGSSPSARDIASLEDRIISMGVKAIFIETGSNPQIAQQVAADTGIIVVMGLYTHSLSDPSGPASTYIQMLKYDTQLIVESLK